MPTYEQFTQALQAAAQGNLDVLKKLRDEKNLDVESKDQYGNDILLIAAKAGQVDVVQWLIETVKVSLTVADQKGFSLVHCAVLSKNPKLISCLAKRKDINWKMLTAEGDTCLHQAAQIGDVDVFAKLLSMTTKNELELLLSGTNQVGWTPLHYLAQRGNVELMKYWVLHRRASIEAQTNQKQTVLHITAGLGHQELFEYLLSINPSLLDKQDHLGSTPLMEMAKNGHSKLFFRTIHWHASVSKKDKSGRTAFLYLASAGHIEMIKKLLKSRQDILDQKDSVSRNALHFAAANGHQSVVELLIKQGLSAKETDKTGRSLLHYAAEFGHYNLLVFLLTVQKLEIALVRSNKQTILHDVIQANTLSEASRYLIVCYLLRHEKAAELKTMKAGVWPFRKTPLELAKKGGERLRPIVEVLQSGKIPEPTEAEKNAERMSKVVEALNVVDAQQVDENEFSYNQLIGAGNFGEVYQGNLLNEDSTSVAVKKLVLESADDLALRQAHRELKVMSQLRHPKIVALYGYHLNQQAGFYCLIMEFLAVGALHNILRDHAITNDQLHSTWRFHIALDMFEGLAYLHSQFILHRDLKSSSILVDDDWRAKIGDFALAKITNSNTFRQTQTVFTPMQQCQSVAYHPPEQDVTEKFDVYSSGVILWELLTRQKPYADMGNVDIREQIQAGRMLALGKETATSSDQHIIALATLMQTCCAKQAGDRPTAQQAIERLLQQLPDTQSTATASGDMEVNTMIEDGENFEGFLSANSSTIYAPTSVLESDSVADQLKAALATLKK